MTSHASGRGAGSERGVETLPRASVAFTKALMAESMSLGLDSLHLFERIQAQMFDVDRTPVKVGRYCILRRIGSGAMGTVYEAEDPDLDRRVAIKVLRPGHGVDGSRYTERLREEARALGRVNHPSVVTIVDVGRWGSAETPYIVMELVEGGTLERWCDEHDDAPGRVERLIEFALQVAQGLHAAHRCELVHRDIKPANLLIDRNGRIRIADFGLARSIGDPLDATTLGRSIQSSEESVPSSAAGTPAYMAPEQFSGYADARSDQFSWAVTFYEALRGVRPFPGRSLPELLASLSSDRIEPGPGARPIPAVVESVLRVALRADPTARYPSMEAAARALEAAGGGTARRRWFAAGTGLLALTLGSTAVGGTSDPCEHRVTPAWTSNDRNEVFEALRDQGQFASPNATAITDELDRYARSWGKARRELCVRARESELPEAQHSQALRCLERSRVGLKRVALSLMGRRRGDGPAPAVHARELLDELVPLEACSDPEARKSSARYEQVESRLDAAATSVVLGDHAKALKESDEVLREIEPSLYPALRARALALRGRALAERGDLQASGEDLRTAFFSARSAGDDETAFETALELTYLEAEEHRRIEVARRWFASARALSNGRRDPLAPARLAHRLAIIEQRSGSLDEAISASHRAIALVEEHDPGHPQLIELRVSLGNSLADRGEPEAALSQYERALALAETKYGADHPKSAGPQGALCLGLLDLGRLERAQAHCRRAYDIVREVFGPEHVETAHRLANYALLAAKAGDAEVAAARWSDALQIFERVLGPLHPRVARVQQNLGSVLVASGQFDAGFEMQHRALETRRAVLGPEHPDLAHGMLTLASGLARADRTSEAGPLLRQAISILDGDVPLGSNLMVFAHTGLANSLWEEGRGAEILEVTRPIIAAMQAEDSPGRDPELDAWAYLTHARGLRAQGSEREALAAARTALAAVGRGAQTAAAMREEIVAFIEK